MFLCKAENGKRVVTVRSAPYGGPRNGRDGHNQRFSERTNFHLDKYGLPPLVYYHGWKPDGRPAETPVYIGKTTKVWADDTGVWHEGELFDNIPEADRIWEAGQADKVFASTGTSPLARVWPSGEIAEWPIVELTLVDVDGQRQVINPYAVTYMGDKLPPHLVKARQVDEELTTAVAMEAQNPEDKTMFFLFKTPMSPDPAAASGGAVQDASQNSGASGTAEAVAIDYEKLAKAIKEQFPLPDAAPAAEAPQAPAPVDVEQLVKAEVEKRLANYVGNNGGLQKAGAQMPAAPLTEDKFLTKAIQDYANGFEQFFRFNDRSGINTAISEAKGSPVYQKALKGKNPLVKAVVVGTDADGGYWVPETFANQVFEFQRERNIFRTMAEKNMVMWENFRGTKEHSMPSWSGDGGPTAVRAEGGAYTIVNPSAGVIKWNPYANGFTVQASDEHLQDEYIDVWGSVIVPFAKKAFDKWENHNFTLGTGTAMPKGVTAMSALGKTATSTTAITAQEFIDLYYSLDEWMWEGTGLAAMMNKNTLALLTGLVRPNTEIPLVRKEGTQHFVFDVPVVLNSRMPAATAGLKPIILGNFNYMKIYSFDSGQFAMRRLNERYADDGLVGFRFAMRGDSEVLDPAGFKHLIMAAS